MFALKNILRSPNICRGSSKNIPIISNFINISTTIPSHHLQYNKYNYKYYSDITISSQNATVVDNVEIRYYDSGEKTDRSGYGNINMIVGMPFSLGDTLFCIGENDSIYQFKRNLKEEINSQLSFVPSIDFVYNNGEDMETDMPFRDLIDNNTSSNFIMRIDDAEYGVNLTEDTTILNTGGRAHSNNDENNYNSNINGDVLGVISQSPAINIRKQLSAENERCISYEKFANICKSSGISNDEQIVALCESFHNAGVIYHYNNNDKQIIFTNPEEIADIVYSRIGLPVPTQHKTENICRMWKSEKKKILSKLEQLNVTKIQIDNSAKFMTNIYSFLGFGVVLGGT